MDKEYEKAIHRKGYISVQQAYEKVLHFTNNYGNAN